LNLHPVWKSRSELRNNFFSFNFVVLNHFWVDELIFRDSTNVYQVLLGQNEFKNWFLNKKKQLLDFSITTMVDNYWACKRNTHASFFFFLMWVEDALIWKKKIHACKLKLVVSSEPGHLGPHVWIVFFVMWCIFQFILRCWIFIGFFYCFFSMSSFNIWLILNWFSWFISVWFL